MTLTKYCCKLYVNLCSYEIIALNTDRLLSDEFLINLDTMSLKCDFHPWVVYEGPSVKQIMKLCFRFDVESLRLQAFLHIHLHIHLHIRFTEKKSGVILTLKRGSNPCP